MDQWNKPYANQGEVAQGVVTKQADDTDRVNNRNNRVNNFPMACVGVCCVKPQGSSDYWRCGSKLPQLLQDRQAVMPQ